ncbi:GNAT family N-acetyltransferase [Salinibius halmophilus]|uniref:GNAT family N-acetyltransferase n=1 Tax=Salinibius halmophilus TaxID=1853216 RepID=UPI000E6743FD|nr:GNAT family N-acetyltransferase [Salinibius halmophilus]
MTIQVRPAEPQDAIQLVKVSASAFGFDGPPGFDDTDHQVEAMGRYHYFAVERIGQIAAGFYYQATPYGIHLLRLFVDPSNQRMGAGSAVIKFLEEKLSPGQRIQLDTDIHSHQSHSFYLNQGFELIGQVNFNSGSALRFSKTKG